ncbi:MAG TPA: zinc metalloprotease HtpX, partial [Elusimicrobiota bacterium]|nr:zinc metalloprotease HtpX [Elusimicrobiota bacterium]
GKGSMIAALERLKSAHDGALPKQMQAFGISGGSNGLRTLFMSHPPLEQRIAALKQS